MRCFIIGCKERTSGNKFKKGQTRQTIKVTGGKKKDRLAKQNSESRRRRLTSSREGVEDLPATIAWLLPAQSLLYSVRGLGGWL
jgi:hypothetical protein